MQKHFDVSSKIKSLISTASALLCGTGGVANYRDGGVANSEVEVSQFMKLTLNHGSCMFDGVLEQPPIVRRTINLALPGCPPVKDDGKGHLISSGRIVGSVNYRTGFFSIMKAYAGPGLAANRPSFDAVETCLMAMAGFPAGTGDVYRRVASRVLTLPEDSITAEQRTFVKSLCLMNLYNGDVMAYTKIGETIEDELVHRILQRHAVDISDFMNGGHP
jgi:hypothetical protein